jgi:hypothetical protein
MREADIQSKIIKALEKMGWYVVKHIQTNKNGWPDLEAKKHERLSFYVEVKRPGEKPTPLQLYRHKELQQMGFRVYVIDSIEDLKNIKELS